MTPAARLAAAASILDTLDGTAPVEPQLKAWARRNRYAGSKDRRAIADRVYSVIRCRRSCAAQGGGEDGRSLVLGSLIRVDGIDAASVADLCSGGYGLAPLSGTERARLSSAPVFESEGMRLDVPDWLLPELRSAFRDALEAELSALRNRAPVDLRVNTLAGSRDEALTRLRAEGFEPTALPHAPTALRLAPGTPVAGSTCYADGLIELQDAGSQAVAALTKAAPGQTVLDYCAGAGGKTLSLAAMMGNSGALLAHDVNPARMNPLPERAARAGASCISVLRNTAALVPFEDACDAVLVDAPCSGSGSWRRDPAGKWRLTADGLDRLMIMQDEALHAASCHVRPGGRLVYATCSVLPAENERAVERFVLAHGAFTISGTLRLHPARDGCDGFFGTVLERNR